MDNWDVRELDALHHKMLELQNQLKVIKSDHNEIDGVDEEDINWQTLFEQGLHQEEYRIITTFLEWLQNKLGVESLKAEPGDAVFKPRVVQNVDTGGWRARSVDTGQIAGRDGGGSSGSSGGGSGADSSSSSTARIYQSSAEVALRATLNFQKSKYELMLYDPHFTFTGFPRRQAPAFIYLQCKPVQMGSAGHYSWQIGPLDTRLLPPQSGKPYTVEIELP